VSIPVAFLERVGGAKTLPRCRPHFGRKATKRFGVVAVHTTELSDWLDFSLTGFIGSVISRATKRFDKTPDSDLTGG
jgi:hypothetical protein